MSRHLRRSARTDQGRLVPGARRGRFTGRRPRAPALEGCDQGLGYTDAIQRPGTRCDSPRSRSATDLRCQPTLLASAAESDLLQAANLRTRVGYVVYPLSSQPNFPATQWETIVDLARTMSLAAIPWDVLRATGCCEDPAWLKPAFRRAISSHSPLRDPDALAKSDSCRSSAFT